MGALAPVALELLAPEVLAAGLLVVWLCSSALDGFVPKGESVIEPGDQVLLILDPGLEAQITPQFAPNGAGPGGAG